MSQASYRQFYLQIMAYMATMLTILYNYLLGHESRCLEGGSICRIRKSTPTLTLENNSDKKSHTALGERTKKVLIF